MMMDTPYKTAAGCRVANGPIMGGATMLSGLSQYSCMLYIAADVDVL